MYIYVYIYHLCQRNNRNNTFRNNRIIIKIAQVSLIEGNSVFKGICMSTLHCQDILVFVDDVFITLTDKLTGLILLKSKYQRGWALIWIDSCWAYVLVCLHFCNWICIHHWRHFRSSYRKSTWVGIEPTTTAFRSDALNRGELSSCSVDSRSESSHYSYFHFTLCSVFRFHFHHCLCQ